VRFRIRQTTPEAPFVHRQRRTSVVTNSPERTSENAESKYERYVALARTEASAGNRIGAANYYQHAEHFFRSMSSDPRVT
jgi:hypothetical protein